MGVRGDELGLADARGGVDDGIGAVEAMVEAHIRCGEGDGLVERDHFAGNETAFARGGEFVRESGQSRLHYKTVL